MVICPFSKLMEYAYLLREEGEEIVIFDLQKHKQIISKKKMNYRNRKKIKNSQ